MLRVCAALLYVVQVWAAGKYNLTSFCPVAGTCGRLATLDARHRCVMDELWGATGATHTHYVKIVSMHEGLGNNIRGFAGMVGLAMVTGRGLILSYPDIERNFLPPTARPWVGDFETAARSAAMEKHGGKPGSGNLRIAAMYADNPLYRPELGEHRGQPTVLSFDSAVLAASPFITARSDATVYNAFNHESIRECVAQAYGLDLGKASPWQSMVLLSLFGRPSPLLRATVGAIQQAVGAATVQPSRDGDEPAATAADTTPALLDQRLQTLVSVHLRTRPKAIERASEVLGTALQRVAALRTLQCAELALAGIPGLKVVYFATDSPQVSVCACERASVWACERVGACECECE